jgi:dsDNA-specific endonuclease/ATPase MutS2
VAKNRTQKLRTIAYAGGWTEGVYLAAKVEIDDKKKIHLEVEEQMTILDKLLKALERDVDQNSGPLADLLKQLKKMKRTYEKDAPKPGEELSDELMKSLKEQALKARRIISNEDP